MKTTCTELTIDGKHIHDLLRITRPTLGWYQHAQKLGLGEDAEQIAAIAVIEKREQALASKNPARYMSGVIGGRLKTFVLQHTRQPANMSQLTDVPMDRFTVATPDPKNSDDPFDLVPETLRPLVRDYMSWPPLKRGVNRIELVAKKHGISRDTAFRRIRSALQSARANALAT